MHKSAVLLILGLLLVACGQVHRVQNGKSTSAIPALHAFTDSGSFDLKISELHIDIQVTGNIATTTFDLVFYNDMDRVLEGEFDFPLADGQNISSYALEINGKLRPGVVVEKAKARVAFENTVRNNVDPGLVEKTKGNNFRTRIYPIPAKGYKRVVIGIEQTLDYTGIAYRYQLPLYTSEIIHRFSIAAHVMNPPNKPDLASNELTGFDFLKTGHDYAGELKKEKCMLDDLFGFSLPADENNKPVVLTENFEDEIYFYINTLILPKTALRSKPQKIGLLWDISGSAEKRNKQKEIELIPYYMSRLQSVQVLLIPFHITPQPVESFSIESGNSNQLVQRLKNFTADGGTQLGALDLSAYPVDEFLLFSDGISSFGKKEIALSVKPVISINSSSSADYSYLKFVAEQTKGKYIDLTKLDISQAAKEMNNNSLQVVNLLVNIGEVKDLVVNPDLLNHTLSVAGILQSSEASIQVQLGTDKNHILFDKEFALSKKEQPEFDNVKRIWASMKIDQLDRQYEKNKKEITALGKKFSIVTQNTSLLVLERVEDYVQYDITPPEELQKEYYTLLKEKQKEEAENKTATMDESLEAMKNLKAWWNRKTFMRKKKLPLNIISGIISGSENMEMALTYHTDSAGRTELQTAPPPPPGMPAAANLEVLELTPGIIQREEEVDVKNNMTQTQDDKHITPTTDINVNKWKPDAEYMALLEKTQHSRRFEKYLELKKTYGTRPSFFVDVARFFYENGDKPTALLVLSNVAEMKIEDAELLRIMAFRLMEMSEFETAIDVFSEIRTMREEEPHAYRDLALAYNEAGMYNEAIPLLYQLITRNWDDRFGDVKSIALNEMNAILSAHPGSVNISGIDKRLIYPMPVDVRIVIGWTSDNSDIDLWVTDPKQEKCFYSHTETSVGGKISEDVTQGYGPEEFSLRNAVDGEYVVEANLFGDSRQTLGGPITISADLFTDFGKPTQKKRTINFRVDTNKEVVKIGVLKIDH